MSKILIIEDDQFVANVYRNKFAVESFQTEIALDGETGLELVDSFKPDVILLDLMLPKISGVDLLKKIRSQPGLEKLPIIVFSNTYLTNIVQDAWKAGATKCLSKTNCSPSQILDVVRGLIPSAPVRSAKASDVSVTAVNSVEEINAESEAEALYQSQLRQSFISNTPVALASLRTSMQALVRSTNDTDRSARIQELYQKTHSLAANAGVTGLHQAAQLADALEAFLRELSDKPKSLNVSSMRTLANAIDFLGPLVADSKLQDDDTPQEQLKAQVLVVDDEAISRRAVVHALDKAKLQSLAVEDPVAALDLLGKTAYDLIFLDVDMPGMNGFELCTKLRSLYNHKKTPVVFVTTLSDFDSRAHSSMSGGTDLIAKPFLFMELAVKALVHLLRSRPSSIRAAA